MLDSRSDWSNIYFDLAEIASRAHFATEHGPVETWFRQTPGRDGVFGRTAFSAEPSGWGSEWLVVCDEPPAGLRSVVPVERRILFLGEPPSIKTYPTNYLDQFGTVVGPIALPRYAGHHIRSHSSLPWHYGKSRPFSWRELAADKKKSQLISVVCSAKTFTMQQMLRIRFVEALKTRFGAQIDHFGNGFSAIEEKADGLAPYRFTVVLENNTIDGFWTEKLGDAYLGDCFPIYAGGKVPAEDFDARARLDINLFRVDEALQAIEHLIETADFDDLHDSIRAQRRRVMTEHNLFAVADRLISASDASGGALPRAVEIRTSAMFSG